MICQKVLDSKLQMKYHSKIHTATWNVSSMEPDTSQKNIISSSSGLTTLDVRADSNSSVSEKVLMAAVAEKKSMDRADVSTCKYLHWFAKSCICKAADNIVVTLFDRSGEYSEERDKGIH